MNADADVLEKLRIVGGPKLVRELVELFLKYAPERLSLARAGMQAGDLGRAQRAMHSLKSSAGQLGVTEIQDACRRGESAAASGDAAGAAMALSEAEAAWPATREWLTQQVSM